MLILKIISKVITMNFKKIKYFIGKRKEGFDKFIVYHYRICPKCKGDIIETNNGYTLTCSKCYYGW